MSLKDAFQGMKEAHAPAPRLVPPVAAVTRPKAPPGQKTGKSANPDFEPVKIYIRRDSHKAAQRKLFDDDRDFSDLMQQLLDEHLST